MRKFLIPLSCAALLAVGCGGFGFFAQPTPAATLEPTWTASPLPSPIETATVVSPSATPTLVPTDTPIPSPSPTFTVTPTPTLDQQWFIHGPGEITIPILLYHHIGISRKGSPYYVSPDVFEQQLELLYRSGYRTISVERLVNAIKFGAELPPRPIILTFDDGSESLFSAAFPLMYEYNFTGTAYIVYNYIGAGGYLDVDQIRELYASGWEIGSHGLSHIDLTKLPNRQEDEIINSRWKLQDRLGVPVLTFAYPFGAYDEDSVFHARYAGYMAAMGLGADTVQGEENLFYLYRREVKESYDLETFASFLPWR